MPRVDIASVLETFRFASAELGSEEAGMAVAMRAFALSVRGKDELLTEAAQVAGMIADRLPEVKGAPVVWPKAANGSR